MEMQPNQETGASIHERLLAKLSDEPLPESDAAEQATEVEEVPQETQEVVDTVDSDARDEEGEVPLTTAALAQYMGIDESLFGVDEDGTPYITANVDGEQQKAKLSDLVTSYQVKGRLDNRLREIAAKEKAMAQQFEEHKAAVEQQLLGKIQDAQDVLAADWNDYVAKFQSVPWETLRVQDPAEYAAKRADFQAEQARIANKHQRLEERKAEFQESIRARQEAESAKLAEVEKEKLSKFIPTWENEKKDLIQWAVPYMEKWGEDPNILNGVTKGMVFDLLRTKMLYEKQQEQKSVVEQKVRIAPKLVKSGTASTPQDNQAASIKSMRQVIKKSGGKDGLKEYLIATGRA